MPRYGRQSSSHNLVALFRPRRKVNKACKPREVDYFSIMLQQVHPQAREVKKERCAVSESSLRARYPIGKIFLLPPNFKSRFTCEGAPPRPPSIHPSDIPHARRWPGRLRATPRSFVLRWHPQHRQSIPCHNANKKSLLDLMYFAFSRGSIILLLHHPLRRQPPGGRTKIRSGEQITLNGTYLDIPPHSVDTSTTSLVEGQGKRFWTTGNEPQ